tara:strand:- start:118 stop:420 length:303 start_codon:yes stop_codon:yes gene_type:complete
MFKILSSLILSIVLWTCCCLLSQSPIEKDLRKLSTDIIASFVNLLYKIIQLLLLLVKDLFISHSLNQPFDNNKNNQSTFNELVSESDYPFHISEICKELS